MGNSKRIMRRLQDIRTLSGRGDQASAPHQAYMKLSCLEMEKFRRGKEKNSALNRVKNIDARFRDIEAEKAAILLALNEGNKNQESGARGQETDVSPIFDPRLLASSGGLKPAPRKNTGGFKLRY